MTPAVQCCITSVLLFPGAVLAVGKVNCSTRCNLYMKSTKPSSLSLFSQYRRKCALHHKLHTVSATETDVEVSGKEETSEEPSNESAGATLARDARKSETPAVKNEDLILGATFTGKVRSIQPFGAFVDIGAFTNGLVHISRLSDSFVEDVGSVVSIGQEVKVRVIEVNLETKRLGFSMREGDDDSKPAQRREARNGPPRSSQKKPSKFEIGEKLVATVKNLTRAGSFITLPNEEEGFLPRSEEKGGGSALAVGQEIKVQVLSKNNGQATLTMMEESITGQTQSTATEMYSDGDVHVAANPFMLAFRSDKDIAMFLDGMENSKKTREMEMPEQNETGSSITEAQGEPAK